MITQKEHRDRRTTMMMIQCTRPRPISLFQFFTFLATTCFLLAAKALSPSCSICWNSKSLSTMTLPNVMYSIPLERPPAMGGLIRIPCRQIEKLLLELAGDDDTSGSTDRVPGALRVTPTLVELEQMCDCVTNGAALTALSSTTRSGTITITTTSTTPSSSDNNTTIETIPPIFSNDLSQKLGPSPSHRICATLVWKKRRNLRSRSSQMGRYLSYTEDIKDWLDSAEEKVKEILDSNEAEVEKWLDSDEAKRTVRIFWISFASAAAIFCLKVCLSSRAGDNASDDSATQTHQPPPQCDRDFLMGLPVTERREVLKNLLPPMNAGPDVASQEGCCAICQESLLGNQYICRSHDSNCKDHFHRSCILEWLLEKDSCPCCQRNFLSAEAG